MNDPLRYKKGPMGYLNDLRRSMGELEAAAGEWCKAFDAGDMLAIKDISDIIDSVLNDIKDAGEGLKHATE